MLQRRRRTVRVVLVGVVSLALVAGVALGVLQWRLSANLSTATVGDHLVEDDTDTGALNVLFIGSDSRDLRTSKHGNGDGSRRSDALVLAHVAADNSRIDAVQIPRDTLLDLPSCDDADGTSHAGGPGMINAALQHGPACSVRAVEALSDVHVHHFVELDFDGFADMVDALGGVGVCLPEALRDDDAHLDLPAGKQRVDGTDALALARTRHAIGDGSDLSRIGHQQVVMSAIIHEVRSAEVLTRPDRLVRFLDAATQSMTVDDDLASTRALGRLAQRVRSVDPARITFMAMPTAAAPQDPNRVVATDDARTVFSAIDADEPVRLASDRPAPSPKHAPIEVLNGARVPGLAASAAGQLESLGHTVVAVGDAQEPAERTILVVDGSDRAKRTAAAVARSFGLDVEPQVDPDVAGVRLVLGASDATGLQVRDTPAVETTSRHADEDLCS
jgi:LCP family protein required for cell wall assembly